MLEAMTLFSLGILGLTKLISLARFFAGPSIIDRLMVIEVLTISSLSVIILISIFLNSIQFYDLILLGALVPFIGSVVVASVFSKRRKS